MTVIGLAGKKQSGKDTVYEIARKQLPKLRVGRAAFADPLKAEVAHVTQMNVSFIEANKDKLRLLLQAWGADFRRQFYGQEYWVNAMRHVLRDADKHADVLFITDLRYENEAEFVHELGGVVVRVDRWMVNGGDDTHSSEMVMDGYDGYDHAIDNNGDKSQLADAVAALLTKFLPSSDGTENTETTTREERK